MVFFLHFSQCNQINKFCFTQNHGAASFGPPQKIQVCPTNYLKKHSRPQPIVGDHVTKFIRVLTKEKKPAAPSRLEKPIMGLQTDKCYVTSNALEVIRMKPQKAHNDGEEHFMQSDGYGEIPSYLAKVKEEIDREQKIVDECVRRNNEVKSPQEPEYFPMNEEERQSLIIGLKTKWDKVNAVYQKKGHQTTLEYGERKRREAQEIELDQLEKDIALLTRPGPIFIQRS